MNAADHPALQRTYWVNLYKNGDFTGIVFDSRELALHPLGLLDDRSIADQAEQVEVKIVPVEKTT